MSPFDDQLAEPFDSRISLNDDKKPLMFPYSCNVSYEAFELNGFQTL